MTRISNLRRPVLGKRALSFGVGAILLAGFSMQHAIGNVFSSRAPVVALAVDRDHPKALARLADAQFAASEGKERISPAIIASLRESLTKQPLSRRTLRLLAVDADLAGDADQAAAMMAASNQVSRRDSLTQFWLMGKAAEAGDWEQGLVHLDAGLSTNASARSVIFKLISEGLSDSQLRDAMAPFIRRERPWVLDFMNYAVDEAEDTVSVSRLLEKSAPIEWGNGLVPLQGRLVARLVADGEVSRAFEYSRAVLGADQDELDIFSIKQTTLTPPLRPLTWQLSGSDHIRVKTIDQKAEIRAAAGPRASALTRYFKIGSGRHRLTYVAQPNRFQELSEAFWLIQCLQDRELRRLSFQEVFTGDSVREVDFEIPVSCEAIRVDLVVESGDAGGDTAISVTPLTMQAF